MISTGTPPDRIRAFFGAALKWCLKSKFWDELELPVDDKFRGECVDFFHGFSDRNHARMTSADSEESDYNSTLKKFVRHGRALSNQSTKSRVRKKYLSDALKRYRKITKTHTSPREFLRGVHVFHRACRNKYFSSK